MPIKLYDGPDYLFQDACGLADIPATRRQYKKWLRKQGTAYKFKARALAELNKDLPPVNVNPQPAAPK